MTKEQLIVLFIGLLIGYAAFRVLAGLIRIAVFLAICATVWVLLSHPDILGRQITDPPPEVKMAVAEFDRCIQQVVASIGRSGESECKQRVMAFLQEKGVQQYIEEAIRAIDAYIRENQDSIYKTSSK